MATIGFQLDTRNIRPEEVVIYLPTFWEKQKYLTQLSDSYCPGVEEQAKCQAIGQKIFNHYKKFAGENSLIGIMALARIYTALDTSKSDLKSFVDNAWNGVGDANYKWKCGVATSVLF